ncbi:MAG: hypothetical protein Q8882_04230 [Bacillota bacterium]|nr:hypothetical protein [Bacillota bacterium]
MDKKDSNKELNEFENQLNEIKEWQKNAYNPGFFIGTGRVPLPLKNLHVKGTVHLSCKICF